MTEGDSSCDMVGVYRTDNKTNRVVENKFS